MHVVQHGSPALLGERMAPLRHRREDTCTARPRRLHETPEVSRGEVLYSLRVSSSKKSKKSATGREESTNLQDGWRPPGFPEDTYFGVAAPDYPNLFLLLGPNSTDPSGTLPHSVENQVTYLAKVLRKVPTQGIRTIQPTWAATRDFRAHCESFFPRTVLSGHCSS